MGMRSFGKRACQVKIIIIKLDPGTALQHELIMTKYIYFIYPEPAEPNVATIAVNKRCGTSAVRSVISIKNTTAAGK